MFNFGKKKKLAQEMEKLAEAMFDKNLELVNTNKTLSFLEELYEASVLSLMPSEMANKITSIICKDLHLEFVGILMYEKEALIPLSFSKSERFSKILEISGFALEDLKITNISGNNFLKEIIDSKKENLTENLHDIWQGLIPAEQLEKINAEAKIKTVLLFPFLKDNEVFGILLISFNRGYDNLSTFERNVYKQSINVIGLLIQKAYLYKNLQDSYILEKKAKEEIDRAYSIEKTANENLVIVNEKEKKVNEDLVKLDQQKNDFLKQTQHDLGKPLTIIMGYCELLLAGTLGKIPKKATEKIKNMQIVSQEKIKDINSFLGVERWKLKEAVTLTPGVELLPILDEIMNVLNPDAQLHGLYLKFEKPKKTITVSADREILKAAIFNVISNAIKYTLKGGIDIKIENKLPINESEQKKVRITVSDTGIGIPQDKLESILTKEFERTEQAKKTASGSGVGLPGSAKIIKLHNGKIWAESKGENQGSTFFIELPLS